jgi:prepilin peptidase CpaA
MSEFAEITVGVAVGVMVAAMLYGAASDLGRFTIPNWVSILVAAAFLPAALAAGLDLEQILLSVGVGLGCLAVGIGAFALSMFGGGDIKLFVACALWTGWPAIAPYLLAVAIAGGVLSLLLLGFRCIPLGARLAGVGWVAALHRKGGPVPYGVAIAAGTLISLPKFPVMAALIAG